MMTSGPEFGSVAPPARMPPRFSVATQMKMKVTIAEHQRHLGDLRRKVDPDRHDGTDHGEEDRGCRAVMEEHRCGRSIDAGKPPGLPGEGGHEVVQRLGRPTRADDGQEAEQPPHHRPDRLGGGHPHGPSSHERRVRAHTRPQEDRQEGVEEHATGTAPEWGCPTVKDVAETFPEPPDGDRPDDGEGQGGFEGSLPDDPQSDEELYEREEAVAEYRVVVHVRCVPGDGVRHPPGIARRGGIEHATEAVRPPDEHERLELQHRIE